MKYVLISIFSRPTLIVLMLVKLIWCARGAALCIRRGKCGLYVCRYVCFRCANANTTFFFGHKQNFKICKRNLLFPNLEKPCHIPCIPQENGVTSLFVRTEQAYMGLSLIPVLTADIWHRNRGSAGYCISSGSQEQAITKISVAKDCQCYSFS